MTVETQLETVAGLLDKVDALAAENDALRSRVMVAEGLAGVWEARFGELAGLRAIAADHLRQYAAYSDAMRAVGRGMTPSSPVTTDCVVSALAVAVAV